MVVRVSSTQFFRYLASQSTTRVARVREAKRVMEAPRSTYNRVDYWLILREASVGLLTGKYSARQFNTAIGNVSDPKKLANYNSASSGLQKWIGRKSLKARPISSATWSAAGLEVAVTPEVLLWWAGSPKYVVKLYFSAEDLSKYQANPMLRLLELTHGRFGTAAILDTQHGKFFTGPTARSSDLDILLVTEAASFVQIWSKV